MPNAVTIIACLCLFEAAALPGGTVRRVSLLGYQVGAEVLELHEAAVRAGRPGLVRLEPTPAPCSDMSLHSEPAPEPANDRVIVLDEEEPAPASVERPVGSDVELEAPSDPPPADLESEIEPAPAQVHLCTHCKGGKLYRSTGCVRCCGFSVAVFLDNRQITTGRPPTTDAERLGAVNAVSDLFADLTDRQRRDALDLFHFLVRGGSAALRTQALAQWKLRAENEAFDRMIAETQEGGA